MTTRRVFLLATASAGWLPTAGRAQDAVVAKLMQAGPLPEMELGAATAPVTVIQYASLTCHHCQRFHADTWPGLKAKYVDTGKVRFIVREFPLDPLAAGGFMLARCSGDKWYGLIDALYQTQESWSHAEKPVEALLQVVRQAGFSKESFEACLSDDALLRKVLQVSERGKELGVNSTPTFFVNGARHVGALSLVEFEKILAPYLQGR